MPPSVRPATPSDALTIATLHIDSWRATYRGILSDAFLDGPVDADRRAHWTSRLADLANPSMLLVIAEDGRAPVGFACAFIDVDPTWGALLDNLHVSPSCQGQGLGRRLMAHAAAWVLQHRPESRMHLWVYAQNTPARRFYERLGGVITEQGAYPQPDGRLIEVVQYGWDDLRRLMMVDAGDALA